MLKQLRNKKGFFNPKLHLILYALLLITTPFLMLQNYMQEAIGFLSRIKLNIGAFEIPYVLVFAIIMFVGFVVVMRKYITKIRVIGVLLLIFLMWIGQSSTDYYYNHTFYDLQHNWHYFAYGIYAYMIYRFLIIKKRSTSYIIKISYLSALILSSFDEIFQMYISSRVFDIGDIAKDSWGMFIGLLAVLILVENASFLRNGDKFFQKDFKSYLKSSKSLIVFIGIFAYLFLFFSSVLTDITYIKSAIGIPILVFIVFVFIIHNLQFKRFKIVFIIVLASLLSLQIFSIIKNRNNGLEYKSKSLLLYKGIPIVYFDVLIHPNGFIRLADKKTYFNYRDKQFFYSQTEDILVLGCGNETQYVDGFPELRTAQFIYNPEKQKGLQVVMLDTEKACDYYNKLISEDKNVFLIIHQGK